MDRSIVYPGAIPQDTDLLQPQRNALVALGQLMAAILGSGTWTSGLSVIPGSGLSAAVQPGQIFVNAPIDSAAYGSLAMSSSVITKQAALMAAATLNTPAPLVAGQSINYLVQIRYLETDGNPLVLPYYNSANPAIPLNGPANAGTSQNTTRNAVCDVQILAGTAATTGSQVTPSAGAGFSPLVVITVAYGQSTIVTGNIVAHGSAPQSVAKALLTQIMSVDGAGSGLDADTVDGLHAASFLGATATAVNSAKLNNKSWVLIASGTGTIFGGGVPYNATLADLGPSTGARQLMYDVQCTDTTVAVSQGYSPDTNRVWAWIGQSGGATPHDVLNIRNEFEVVPGFTFNVWEWK